MTLPERVAIPESHRDLLDRPIVVTFVTLMQSGQPQATPVWIDFDGETLTVNSRVGRTKDRNVKERPRVTILAIDPDDPYRWMEVRGVVEHITEAGGKDVIEKLSRQYTGMPYYGGYAPAEREFEETRINYRIRPTHVATNHD